MKAFLLCGSPRANGNTEFLVRRCAARLESAGISSDVVLLRGKNIHPCTGCGKCRELQNGACSIKNDDFHPVFANMREADIIVVGSPVYFGSATPETMAFLDRAGYISRQNGNFFSRKIGGPIVVARRAGHNFTFAQLLMWYMINELIVPGSSYWNIAFGRAPGEVENDTEGLETVDRFAENLAWLAKMLNRE